MKKLLLAVCLLCPLGGSLSAQTTDRNVAVLAYSADQLAAKFAGQTRKSVVSAINTVPASEQIFTAQDGKEYELIRYGGAHQDYRQFLFEFKLPQPLIGVADSPKGIVAFNEKYGLNIPVTQQSLARNTGAFLTTVTDVANGTEYQVYQNGGEYMLFQNGQLTQTFTNAQEYAAFMSTITASNSAYAAQQAEQQTALEQAQLARQNTSTQVRRTSYVAPIIGTALVGGLVWGAVHHWHHRPSRHSRPAPRPGPRPGPGAHGHRR
ncbi:MAG: hypothetical protein IJ876_05490 [Elusimicrobiaceae bacterium]|nr:hypothetical protein [Elusimicrobiaceae bacterium]